MTVIVHTLHHCTGTPRRSGDGELTGGDSDDALSLVAPFTCTDSAGAQLVNVGNLKGEDLRCEVRVSIVS